MTGDFVTARNRRCSRRRSHCWTLALGKPLAVALLPSPRKLTVGGLYLAYALLTTVVIEGAKSSESMIALLLIVNLWPVAALALGAHMFSQRLSAWFGIGLLFTVAGGVLVVSDGVPSLTAIQSGLARQPLLTFLAAIAASTWALCSNLMRKWPHEGEHYMIFGMGLAALTFSVFAAPDVARRLPSLDFPPVLLILAAANAAGFACWEIGMRKGRTAIVVVFHR